MGLDHGQDGLPFSEAAERNGEPILAVLAGALAPDARVLEVASGTGQHARRMALAMPGWRWWPSDRDGERLEVVAARCAGLANVAQPLRLDVQALPWDLSAAVPACARLDAVLAVNLLHAAPWPATRALLAGAAGVLRPGGLLAVYGPFVVDGEPTAPSNLAFDAELRRRDPSWGLRHLGEVLVEATPLGLALERRIAMPANNQMLMLRRGAGR